MRLDKYISENTLYSRSEVKRLIKNGRISIDKHTALSPSQKLKADQTVYIDTKPIAPVGQIYLQLNKPKGYVCATSDANHPTVIDLISDESRFIGTEQEFQRLSASCLQIVGRLDIDTTGLLLLTNDGQWNHRITSPNSECHKSYIVDLAEEITQETAERFAAGIMLRNEEKPTEAAKLEVLGSHSARVMISEGRYHQVKRMFAACNNRVIKLHRERIGALPLCDKLAIGNFRLLSMDESV